MSNIREFEDIEAWKIARKLTKHIYEFTNVGKFKHDYPLRDQIRRAGISIMSNIAEGFESQTQALFITYLGRSKASAGEVRSQLYLAYDLGYLNYDDFISILNDVKQISRSLYKFIVYLRSLPNTNRY